MGRLPAVLAVISLFSMLSVVYFSIKTRSGGISTQRLRHRDNLRYSLTDGNLRNPTMNSDSVASIRVNTPWHSVHSRKTDSGLVTHKLTNQSLERIVVTVLPTEAHFTGMRLQSHLRQTEGINSLTAEPPSVNKRQAVSGSAATNCSDSLCSQYLSRSDRSYFSRCQSMARLDPFSDKKNAQCRFMDGRGRDPVALVSVPGAGNTWVRSLIEKASGICTGAIYCDLAIRKGFVGEYVHSGSVIVVKTHTSDYQWKGDLNQIEKRNHEDALYGSAILLIRSPFDTFVSERNRVVSLRQLGGKAEHGIYAPVPYGKSDSSHIHALDKEYFGNCSEWNGFLYGIGPRWKKTIEKWFLDPRSLARPVLVVRYEDLKRDPVEEVKRMLEFLKFTFDEQSLAERLAKKASESFHRNHTDINFEHYTTEQKKYINSLLQDTIQLLKQRGVEQRFNLHEYLR